MTLREQIEALSTDREATKRPAFKKLSDFYREKKEEGVVIKKEYDLPPMDTVGRTLYREISNKSRHKK